MLTYKRQTCDYTLLLQKLHGQTMWLFSSKFSLATKSNLSSIAILWTRQAAPVRSTMNIMFLINFTWDLPKLLFKGFKNVSIFR